MKRIRLGIAGYMGLSILLIMGCQAQTSTSIQGDILLHPDWKPVVYLVQPGSFPEIASNFRGKVVDSASVSPDGRFEILNLPESTDGVVYQLLVQKNGSRFANQLMDEIPAAANYMPIVVTKGESLSIQADVSSFQQTFRLESPSADNRALLTLRDLRYAAFEKLQEETRMTSGHDSLLMDHEDAVRRYQNVMMEFADTAFSLMAGLVAIRWISPDGDYERMPEFISGQCRRWREAVPDHIFVKQLCETADAEKLPIQVGNVIPDFEMPPPTGDTVGLHSLLGKEITVLDIWASWCAPCRRENRDVLAPLYSQFKTKGLQIIGYSIDNSASAWTSAIQKDKAVWLHASHLTGDSTPFMDALRITTIPANFILDANGKVMAKNLHGEALDRYVREYLGGR